MLLGVAFVGLVLAFSGVKYRGLARAVYLPRGACRLLRANNDCSKTALRPGHK